MKMGHKSEAAKYRYQLHYLGKLHLLVTVAKEKSPFKLHGLTL